MFVLGIFLASAFLLLAIGLVTQASWLRRHVKRPGLVAALIVGSCTAAIPTSLFVTFTSFGAPGETPPWTYYVVTLLVLLLIGLVFAVFYMRRTPAPAAKQRRLLVVAAHPDDLELACGGSLARFADRGHEIMAIVMSRGGAGGEPEVREQEALSAASHLQLAGISVREFTDTKMAGETEAMVKEVELAVGLFQPDVILTHSEHDQHQDHYAVHLAVMRGGRRCPTILCFESPSVTNDFAPRYFVDIADYVEAKIAAVQEHVNQSGKPYMDAEKLRGMAVFRGSQARVSHAEGFEVMRALSSSLGDL